MLGLHTLQPGRYCFRIHLPEPRTGGDALRLRIFMGPRDHHPSGRHGRLRTAVMVCMWRGSRRNAPPRGRAGSERHGLRSRLRRIRPVQHLPPLLDRSIQRRVRQRPYARRPPDGSHLRGVHAPHTRCSTSFARCGPLMSLHCEEHRRGARAGSRCHREPPRRRGRGPAPAHISA